MKLLEKNVIIYHAVGGEVKQPRVYLSNDAEEMAGGILLNEDETAVAGWVCKNCHKAGCTTNTLPGAAGLYIPIQKDGRVFGVIGIDLKEGAPIKPNDKNVLHVILDETAVVLKAQMIHGYL
jgi:two-component system sensor histidine kinase KdpD